LLFGSASIVIHSGAINSTLCENQIARISLSFATTSNLYQTHIISKDFSNHFVTQSIILDTIVLVSHQMLFCKASFSSLIETVRILLSLFNETKSLISKDISHFGQLILILFCVIEIFTQAGTVIGDFQILDIMTLLKSG
jgi:hypothetical protein